MAMSRAKESIPEVPILFSESNSPTGERTSSIILSSFSFYTSECFGWSDISFPPEVLSYPLK